MTWRNSRSLVANRLAAWTGGDAYGIWRKRTPSLLFEEAILPDTTVSCFNVTDERGLVVSSILCRSLNLAFHVYSAIVSPAILPVVQAP
ncbi:hypothetical protein J3R74_004413 [Puniceicoccus vermicola]